jgi:flagellin
MAQADFTRIATNIGALNALQSLRNINGKLGVHQQRLSTGKRINSAADDPAGLTIATKMLARSEGLKVAMDNIGDAKNMLSVAEAGLGKITDILVQMRSKAEQAASDTLSSIERSAIQAQLSAYAEQITDVVNETRWNGVKLLDGTVDKRFQTGADEGEYTSWQLSQQHDASTLDVSEEVTTDTTTLVAGTGSSFTGQAAVAAL